MANQTSLLAHGSIIQARRRHRPLLPIPTMSPCQGRNPATELRPETVHQTRPKKWPKFRVQKQRGPKTEPRKWSAFLCNRGEARQYGFTPVGQKWCPENGHQKNGRFQNKHRPDQSDIRPATPATSTVAGEYPGSQHARSILPSARCGIRHC